MVLNLFNTIRKRSDEELMGRICADGDERAFNELYRRHARRLQGFFFRMLGGNNSLAADFCACGALELSIVRATAFRRGCSAWLTTCARTSIAVSRAA